MVEQGGRFWDNTEQTFNFNTPEAEKSLQLVADIYLTKHLDSLDLPGDFDAMSQGVKAAAFIWPEYPNYAKTVFPDLELAFAGKPPFVAGNVPIFNHTDTWNAMAFAGTKNAEAVEEFLRFLATPEAQLAFAAQNPGLAIQKAVVYEDPFYQSGGGAFLAPVIASIKAGQAVLRSPWESGTPWSTNLVAAHAGSIPRPDHGERGTGQDDGRLKCRCRRLPRPISQRAEDHDLLDTRELPEGLSWS